MDIGKEERTIRVEPVKDPVPAREPVQPSREPAKPERAPVEAPAK